jgi:hypothetical protein
VTARKRAVAVLDNEAAQVVADPGHTKHRRMVNVLRASDRRRVHIIVPTTVRVEARLGSSSPKGTGLGRLHVEDVPLTGRRADEAIALRGGLTVSVVDATVAQAAQEHASAGALVTVYTSDVSDLEVLCGRAAGRIAVRLV